MSNTFYVRQISQSHQTLPFFEPPWEALWRIPARCGHSVGAPANQSQRISNPPKKVPMNDDNVARRHRETKNPLNSGDSIGATRDCAKQKKSLVRITVTR